jgi:hypothetical protein
MKYKFLIPIVMIAAVLTGGCNSEPEIPKGQSIEHPLGPNGGRMPSAAPSPATTVSPSQPPKGPDEANALVREAMKKSGH